MMFIDLVKTFLPEERHLAGRISHCWQYFAPESPTNVGNPSRLRVKLILWLLN